MDGPITLASTICPLSGLKTLPKPTSMVDFLREKVARVISASCATKALVTWLSVTLEIAKWASIFDVLWNEALSNHMKKWKCSAREKTMRSVLSFAKCAKTKVFKCFKPKELRLYPLTMGRLRKSRSSRKRKSLTWKKRAKKMMTNNTILFLICQVIIWPETGK